MHCPREGRGREYFGIYAVQGGYRTRGWESLKVELFEVRRVADWGASGAYRHFEQEL